MNTKVRVQDLGIRVLTRARGYHSLQSLRKAGLRAGQRVTIGSRTYIDRSFAWAISIGDDVTISWDVSIIAHDAAGWYHTGFTEVRPVVIEAGVYIGAGCLILPGTTIGRGAIIGAGSVVIGNIPDGSVAAGVPCRVISSIADYLEKYRVENAAVPHLDKARVEMTADDIATAIQAIHKHGRVYVR
jgi:maltose O-acetyltransferase